MYEQKLHSRLSYLAGLVGIAYVRPAPAEYEACSTRMNGRDGWMNGD